MNLNEFVFKTFNILSIFFRTSSKILETVLKNGAKDYQNRTKWWPRHRYPLLRILHYLHISVFTLRTVLLSYVLLTLPDMFETLSNYDPTLATVYREYVHNSLFGLSVAPLSAMTIYLDYAVYVKPNPLIWGVLFKQLICENRRNFFKLNPNLKFEFNWFNPFKLAIELLKWLIKMLLTKSAQFDSRLTHFANVDAQIRVRAFLFTMLWELFEMGLQGLSVLVLAIAYVYTQWLMYRNYNGLIFCLGSLDMLAAVYAVWKNVKLGLYFAYCILLISYVYGAHVRNLNQQIYTLLCSCRTQNNKFRPIIVSTRLSYYRAEHLKILNDLIIANQRLAATTMLVAFSSCVIASIYVITVMFFMDMNFIAKYNGALLLLALVFIISLIVAPMIYCIKSVYSGEKYLFPFIGYFGRDWIAQKVKQQNFYELIHTDRKLYFTVGHYANVSNEVVFKFFLFYSAYVMYSFKMFTKNKIH